MTKPAVDHHDELALEMCAQHGRLERRVVEWSDGPRIYWFMPPDFLAGVADATIQSLAARGLVRLEGDVCHSLRPPPPVARPQWTPPGRLI